MSREVLSAPTRQSCPRSQPPVRSQPQGLWLKQFKSRIIHSRLPKPTLFSLCDPSSCTHPFPTPGTSPSPGLLQSLSAQAEPYHFLTSQQNARTGSVILCCWASCVITVSVQSEGWGNICSDETSRGWISSTKQGQHNVEAPGAASLGT